MLLNSRLHILQILHALIDRIAPIELVLLVLEQAPLSIYFVVNLRELLLVSLLPSLTLVLQCKISLLLLVQPFCFCIACTARRGTQSEALPSDGMAFGALVLDVLFAFEFRVVDRLVALLRALVDFAR